MLLKKELFPLPPAGQGSAWKAEHFAPAMQGLTRHHRNACEPYRNILSAIGFDDATLKDPPIEALPFLPTGLFKHTPLISVARGEVKNILASSGTTGRPVSQIALDRTTSARQMLALAQIVAEFAGPERLPLLLLDAPAAVSGADARYNGRAAGIQGFSTLGRSRTFALDDQMRPNIAAIERFLEQTAGGPFLAYGFTFVVWTSIYETLFVQDRRLDLSRGILMHGGGWKRLADRQVSDETFRAGLRDRLGFERVHNYYGMVEQAGSIYVQCEAGFFHSSAFSEIVVRRPIDFSVCAPGEPGVIQTMSLVPTSYPGHNLLTEDEGLLIGENDCGCGRPGRYFLVRGRLKQAELKGCGDTAADGYA